jgi:hypothetical protein
MIYGDLSRLNPEQRAIVLVEPCWRMRWFASLLNWNGVRLEWVRFRDEDARNSIGVPASRILLHYVTTDQEFHIQINALADCVRLYQATIGPFRYGISQVPWHRFELFDDDAKLVSEAQRLKPFLDRQQFRDPVRRAAWKKANPEFLLKRRRR